MRSSRRSRDSRVDVDRVEHRAPHVVLALVVGAVADAHRPGAVVAVQVVEDALVEVALAVDAVHDLELVVALGDVGDEAEEVVGLPVEAEGVEAPQRERGVADPAVAVVPVALAAGRLGQRRGRRRDERAGGRERQALERERAALEVRAPRMVGEVAPGQPVLPVVRGPDQPLVRLVVGVRRRRARSTTSAQKRCSPSFSSVRAVARPPSKPRRMSVVRRSSRSTPSRGGDRLVVAACPCTPTSPALRP